MADVVPPVRETQYVIFDDGSVRATGYEGCNAPPVPELGRVVTEAKYRKAHGAIRGAVEEHRETGRVAEQEALRDDYEALRAAGIPVTTAARLSGFTGHGEGPGEVKP